MGKIKVVTKYSKKDPKDIPDTPEERLDLVEKLRLQAGKFIYEYPARLQRTVKIIRRK